MPLPTLVAVVATGPDNPALNKLAALLWPCGLNLLWAVKFELSQQQQSSLETRTLLHAECRAAMRNAEPDE